jgi:hypothetical protein
MYTRAGAPPGRTGFEFEAEMLESAAGVCEPPAAWFVGVFSLAMLNAGPWSAGWFDGCGVNGRDCSGAGAGIEATESAVSGFEME